MYETAKALFIVNFGCKTGVKPTHFMAQNWTI